MCIRDRDLRGVVLNRNFSEVAATKEFIESQLKLAKEEREAVCVGKTIMYSVSKTEYVLQSELLIELEAQIL